MARFSYKAVDGHGNVVSGELEAASHAASIEQLLALGHTPLQSDEVSIDHKIPWWRRDLFESSKVSVKERVFLTQQLGALVGAGLSLARSLEILINSNLKATTKDLLQDLLTKIQGGDALSKACSTHSKTFPGFYVSLVAAGEESGTLLQMLQRLGDYLGRAEEIRSKITSALIYPAILLVMILLTLIAMVGFVLPQFQPLFEEAGEALPLATEIVLAVGLFLETYGLNVLLGMLILSLLCMWALKNPRIRLVVDHWLLTSKLTFGLIQQSETANFAHTMGTLLENGLTMPKALDATKNTLSNTALQRAVMDAKASVQEGAALSKPIQSSGLFPSLAVQLITVGEETGALSNMLLKLADIYERDVQNTIDRALALLVPIMTLVMGGIVALLMGSIIVGILSINQLAI